MKRVGIIAGPLAALLIILTCDLQPGNVMVTRMAAVTVWMAIWWFSEAVHLSVTALVPFIFLPVLGIADPKLVAYQYMDQIIFLFIGGFLLSFAIERWNLHERIALKILMLAGTKSRSILLGIMATSFMISMWISNTATVMMLLSAVLAIIHMTERVAGKSEHQHDFAKALLIGLAYSATVGGMATLVGTPPNMVFVKAYAEAYPNLPPVTFTRWFAVGFPIALLLEVFCYLLLCKIYLPRHAKSLIEKDYFIDAYKRLGKMSQEQKIVALVFIATALLWFTRADIDLGGFTIKGWNHFFPQSEFIQDSTVAVFMALLLFLIPSKNEPAHQLLNWTEAKKLPLDIILLFGSGFALAKGFEVSGLSDWLAGKLQFFNGSSIYVIILMILVLVTIISEFASNVASIQLVLPILIAFQKDLQVDPLLLMLPATLAASLGFMLPVATAPNTIVFGSNLLTVKEMARAGLFMNVVGILIIWLALALFH
jgi:solute carrier family 13 (sodium-dependent dicarboxylate transporter), member 2/3/5